MVGRTLGLLSVLWTVAGAAWSQTATVVVGPKAGAIWPLLGVNIGPLPTGDPGNADLTEAYRRAGVRQVRTHDFYGPMDLATLYPDQSADPARPESYNFAASDRYWRAIVDGGFEPYLRLGDSYNNAPGYPRAARHPSHEANLARAMVEVVRHYADAKWWGESRLRFVEVWNEPDNRQFWDGSPEQFYRLYCAAATAIKKAFPALQLGGPGFAPSGALAPHGRRMAAGFVRAVRQAGAPLDFLSWHMYANDVASYDRAATFYADLLVAEGLRATVQHVTEYHTSERGLPMAEQIALRANAKGAAVLTACWMALQRHDVRQATVYRGPDPSLRAPQFYGLFYADGRPKKPGLAFGLWSEFCRYPERAETQCATGQLAALAARDAAGHLAVLVANLSDAPCAWQCPQLAGAKRVRQVSDQAEGVSDETVSVPEVVAPPWGVQLVTTAG